MAPGEPCLPVQFKWREQTLEIVGVIEKWKEAGDCRQGSGERYVRKHWYRVQTRERGEAKLYLERQRRSASGSRWRLYSIKSADGGA